MLFHLLRAKNCLFIQKFLTMCFHFIWSNFNIKKELKCQLEQVFISIYVNRRTLLEDKFIIKNIRHVVWARWRSIRKYPNILYTCMYIHSGKREQRKKKHFCWICLKNKEENSFRIMTASIEPMILKLTVWSRDFTIQAYVCNYNKQYTNNHTWRMIYV